MRSIIVFGLLIFYVTPTCSADVEVEYLNIENDNWQSNGDHKHGYTQDIIRFGDTEAKVYTVGKAEFGEVYNGDVQDGQDNVYIYSGFFNESTVMRVHVSSSNASSDAPVLFVIRDRRSVLSWQTPLVLDNSYSYYRVSRTLCSVKRNSTISQTLSVNVACSSSSPTDYTLQVSLFSQFDLRLLQPEVVQVTPSEPLFLRFLFPDEVNSVIVRLASSDSLCMTFSIQALDCPVYDLDHNVEFTGMYQTVTKRGAITVRRTSFSSPGFYVVLVVKPTDFVCQGIGQILPSMGHESWSYSRMKNVTLTVETTISGQEFAIAVLGALCCFLAFYILAIIVHLLHRFHIWRTSGYLQYALPPDGQVEEQPVTPSSGIMQNYGSISDDTGATTPCPADENEVDVLADVETSRVQVKPYLSVADLSKKNRDILYKRYKLYHWNLITVSIFYALPVVQLVITYQKVLNSTGNQDLCYYNFECSRPVYVFSAFNNVYSNIGYVMLGLLFLLIVLRRAYKYQAFIQDQPAFERDYGIPQHFGLFYAMGLGLIMMGLLSACYHVCPSYTNFQFDTSFMYMIAWLCVLKIYQTRHPDLNATSHTAYFALAIVILLSVIGVVYGNIAFWVFFFCVHIYFVLLLSVHVYYMDTWRFDAGIFGRIYATIRSDVIRCKRPLYPDRLILLILANATNLSL